MKAKSPKSHSSSQSKTYRVIPTDVFLTDAKALQKKYPNIKSDFLDLAKSLKKNPQQGESLGGGLFKVRMDISDKDAGKSGCARVVIKVIVQDKEIYVLRALDKGELSTFLSDALKKMYKRGI